MLPQFFAGIVTESLGSNTDLLSSLALISNETSPSCADYVIMFRVLYYTQCKVMGLYCICVCGSDGGWVLSALSVLYKRLRETQVVLL